MKSDRSMFEPLWFKDGEHPAGQRLYQESSDVLSGRSNQQPPADLDSIFMGGQRPSAPYGLAATDEEVLDGEDEEQRRRSRESFVKTTENFLRRMKQEELADLLQSRTRAALCRRKLKSDLKEKFQCVFEGISKAGNPTLLNQVYTELYITEGGTREVNDEHEVRQIEATSRKQHRAETSIRQEDIFKVPPGREEAVRRVLTQGVAGIGKTVLTQKFTLDWAEDKANQDVDFTFPFTFRELNVLKEKKFSLVQLVHHFFSETREAEICRFEDFQVVFIFDGLDECQLPLDFHNTEILTDVTESASVGVLLTNLIRGKLLPSARLWITTRPAAANQIPPECVHMVTEVRGFTDPQKEEFFRKRFRDEEQASSIISHIRTSRSLHIMCHIPVFCWITATVLEEMLRSREGGELPKTLTEMYNHFLVIQLKLKNVKYDEGAETDPQRREMIRSLASVSASLENRPPPMKQSRTGVSSAMNQSEDREEGAPPSKTSLCEDHDSQTKAQRVDHGGEQRLEPDVRKYFCELTLDTNTAHKRLALSDNNKKARQVFMEHDYPDHPDRFEPWPQLLCTTGLTGRCYWEVEWKGGVSIGVTYRGIERKTGRLIGFNDQSWSVINTDDNFFPYHGGGKKHRFYNATACGRVGVYLDCPAGSLTFYKVSSGSLTHIHTFNATFTEPLYPGFGTFISGSSVYLCSVQDEESPPVNRNNVK